MYRRKKNSKIMVGMLIAVVALGIGYAAIAGVNLLINGTSSVKANGNFSVRFVKPLSSETAIDNAEENAIKISGKNADSTDMNVSEMSASITDDTHAEFAVGELDEVGEYVEFTYTVVNESDGIDASLAFEVTDSNDYFEITKTVSKDKISEGETATVKVKVELTATPKVDDYDATFSVTLNATPVEVTSGESSGGNNPSVAEPVSFATDSWDTIVKAVQDNNTLAYNVGDEKTIDMGSFGEQTVRIANMSTPEECSTEGFSQTACGFVLEFKEVVTTHTMNKDDTNVGGWAATSMRTYVNNNIYNALPEELKNGIINTKVVSGHGSSDPNNIESIDKLYLLSTKEVYGKESDVRPVPYDTAEAETRQLDYYNAQGVTTEKYAAKGASKTGGYWWLRSAYSENNGSFFFVEDKGEWSGYTAIVNIGVSPAFRIGSNN